jgi:hypothetical protein
MEKCDLKLKEGIGLWKCRVSVAPLCSCSVVVTVGCTLVL